MFFIHKVANVTTPYPMFSCVVFYKIVEIKHKKHRKNFTVFFRHTKNNKYKVFRQQLKKIDRQKPSKTSLGAKTRLSAQFCIDFS